MAPFDGIGFESPHLHNNKDVEDKVNLGDLEAALQDLDAPLNLEKSISLADSLEGKIKFGKGTGEISEVEREQLSEAIAELKNLQDTAADIGADAKDPVLMKTLARLREIKQRLDH